MKDNSPLPPENIQLTPVEFSPASNPDAIGTVAPPPRAPFHFPLSIPVAIVILTLIFSTLNDIVTLNKKMAMINTENAPALAVLKKVGKQQEFLDSLRKDVSTLAVQDPVAARIAKDFCPPETSPKSAAH